MVMFEHGYPHDWVFEDKTMWPAAYAAPLAVRVWQAKKEEGLTVDELQIFAQMDVGPTDRKSVSPSCDIRP